MKIKIQNVSKNFRGNIQALKEINLEITTGMFGLLGPNGAGKTTLMRILATLIKPSNGRVTVDGFDVADNHQKWAVKQILGYLPQELELYPNLSVKEFLDYIATLKNLHNSQEREEEVANVVRMAGLIKSTEHRIHTLSGGMKRRVGIAQALIGDPKLLIVDEPTVGLDPEERVKFRSLLAQLASNRIVILSTHIVEDIANTCFDMAVMREGQVYFRGSPDKLIENAKGKVWDLFLPLEATLNPSWRIVTQVSENRVLRLRIVGEKPHQDAVYALPSLEEAYLTLMAY